MSNLTDFMLARIAEDEAAARAAADKFHAESGEVQDATDAGWHLVAHIARWAPARVLAECDAKRRIVELAHPDGDDEWVLCYLALPYADHPDYRVEWRPTS